MFKWNSTTIKQIYNESANFIVEFDNNVPSNLTEIVSVLGMKDTLSCTCLRLIWNYLMLDIGHLIKPAAMDVISRRIPNSQILMKTTTLTTFSAFSEMVIFVATGSRNHCFVIPSVENTLKSVFQNTDVIYQWI